ncbi:mannitol-1-phosphate 5-dehydrogenase [Salipaludibacillus aurantiacus]|uniref:Mannitol-1-phosphate 5-dehydrogenase n=1 Tax=Salipaludibacillus aurantiacus TaxID=1601833 RepID=A0A1H9W2L9_9BACI|nr:mannitol-1-phosphate 5-dehydrogenase [Salipaludibacillus aurantiacus]SES28172.1 mannitol-1-phosphate 5-dehydrogenase [Salipaludibacillus aurantiacus]
MRALHFGAGNIGKGFIGYLLNKTGYELCFVDVNQKAIDRFNQTNRYLVETLEEGQTVEVVSPVSALNSLTQEEEVIERIAQADIITTSIGIDNLSRIAPIISKGLLNRVKRNENKLDIIANENAINASSTLQAEVEKQVSAEKMETILRFVGFPNSSIDRLALSKESGEDEIALVEPIYEWVINKKEMANHELPPITGATYVDDLKPFIERKLYMVNMGHATTAYIAFLFNEPTIQSALEKPEIEQFVRGTLNETAQYFIKKFNVQEDELDDYIDKTLIRFKNKNISDNIFRVGRSPVRKLGANERLVKPARELFELGLPIKHLSAAIAAAFLFDNSDDDESVTLQNYIREHGIENAITHFTQINDHTILNSVKANYYHLKTQNYSDLIALITR